MLSFRALILVGLVALWSLAITLWRLALRRLRLSGHGSSTQDQLGQRERAVRRSLRGLLAFNFLIVYPVGIPGLIAVAFSGDPEVLLLGAVPLVGLALFSLALASLIRTAGRLERQRLAGVAMREPSLWIDGGAALVESVRQGRNPHARPAALIIMAAGICWLISFILGNENIRWLSMGVGLVGVLLFEYGQFKTKESSGRR